MSVSDVGQYFNRSLLLSGSPGCEGPGSHIDKGDSESIIFVFVFAIASVFVFSVDEPALFLQGRCGWNCSLEAILDVPET